MDNQSLTPTKDQTYVIGMERGNQYIQCLRCLRKTYNQGDIKELYCSYCQRFHERKLVGPNGPIQQQVECQFCHLPAYKGENGYFVCKNNHKNSVYGITEKAVEPPKPEKKKRVIQVKCPTCHKVAEVAEETKAFGKLIRKYTCGHKEFLPLTAPPLGRDEFWEKFLPFQREGIEFSEMADYKVAINDEMGLGKTWEALGTLRYNYEELTPCLMVVEASKVYDWKNEFEIVVGSKYDEVADEPIIHNGGAFGICPGFKNHIISMSLINKPKVLESIKNYGFKLIIVDESHSFKNEDADRTYALQNICMNAPNYIFLSGTPVMNKVDEFFTTLNILRPSHWPTKDSLMRICDRTSNGKVLGISHWHRDKFFEKTSKYIIRRTKKQVGIQLPKLRINKLLLDANRDKQLVKEYNKQLDFLEEILVNMKMSLASQSEILGIFAKLRHITGIMKVKPVISYVHEFMDSTDPDSKIAIGVHHKDVMEYLRLGLKQYDPICISDEDGRIKAQRVEQFKNHNQRLAILSILGAGQGLNIQFCKNAIQAERQWNPAKEDQFHGRFHRIVKDAEGNIQTEFTEDEAVIIDIVNAKDTIDEYFDAMVELKGKIVSSTDSGEPVLPLDFMLELANKLVSARMKVGI